MMWTIPPVVYGIFRYLYLIYDRADDRSIAAMVSEDRGLVAGRRRLGNRRLRLALRLQVERRRPALHARGGGLLGRLGQIEAGAARAPRR